MGVMWFTASPGRPRPTAARLFPSRGYDPHAARYENQMPVAQQGTGWQIYKVDLDGSSPLAYGQAVGEHGARLRDQARHRQRAEGQHHRPRLGAADRARHRGRPRSTSRASAGPVTVTARHAETGDTIQIYPDNGTNATTFADDSTYHVGLRVPAAGHVDDHLHRQERHADAPNSSVDPAPIVHVPDPDVAGGRDFATTVLGDAWDLTNARTSRRGRLYDMTAATFGPNGLTATTLGPGGDAVGQGDSFVAFLDASLTYPNEVSINADDYYRLSFTLEYLTGKELPGPIALDNDWGAVYRVIWHYRDHGAGGAYSETLPIVMLDGGPQTFSMDLRTLTKTGPVEPARRADLADAVDRAGQHAAHRRQRGQGRRPSVPPLERQARGRRRAQHRPGSSRSAGP